MRERVKFLTEDDELVILRGQTYVARFFSPHGRVSEVYSFRPADGARTRIYYDLAEEIARLAVEQRANA